MTADPVRPQETLRERLHDAAMTPLHQAKVQISSLRRDCACGIVAAVVADAVLPIVEEETKALREQIADRLLTHIGGDEAEPWQAGHNYAMREAARLIREGAAEL